MFTHFLLNREHCPRVSANLQSIFRHYGEFVAGDEKVFRMTGQGGDVRLVPSKKINWYILCMSCCFTNIIHRIMVLCASLQMGSHFYLIIL